MFILLTILAELLFIAGFILTLYRLKHRYGLTPLYVFIGANQFLQTILFTSFKVNLFGGLSISSGSAILFSATLFTVLLIYIKEGVRTTQRFIIAIILANISIIIINYFTHLQEIAINVSGSAIFNVNYKAFLIGTIILVLDTFILVILYELFFTKTKWLGLFTRLFLSLFIVLNFDAIAFATLALWDKPDMGTRIMSQMFGKSVFSVFFASALFTYLRYFDKDSTHNPESSIRGKEDIFSILSYQGKLEKLKTEKAISDSQMQNIIAEKTEELSKSLQRFTILSSVRELRIDKFSTSEQALEILKKIKEAFEADACSIHLLNADKLVPLAGIGISDEFMGENLTLTMPYINYVVKKKKSIAISDISTDKLFNSSLPDAEKNLWYKSCAGAPMVIGDKVIGLLKLYAIEKNRDFSSIEMEHLQLMASQIGHTIENARMFEQNERHKTVLVKQIMARKKVEEAVKKSEEKYRNLIENASDSIILYNFDGSILDCNQTTCFLTGYSKEEILNLNLIDLVFKDDLIQLPFQFEALKKGETTITERRIKHKNGSPIDLEVNTRMMPDGTLMVIGRNLEERKKVEKLIKESEEKYRTLVEQATNGILIIDQQGKIISANKAAVQMSGNTHDCLESKSIYDFVFKKDLEKDPFHFDDLKMGKTVIHERRLKRSDGSGLFVEISAKIMTDGNLLVFLHDLTDRKKAEEEKQFLLSRNKQTLETMMDGFILADTQGIILDANPAYCQMSGYSKMELLQINIFELEAAMNSEEVEQSINNLMELKTLQLETKHRRKDGQLIDIEVSLSIMEFDNQPLVAAFIRNITDRKINELKINEYTNQLKNLTGHLLEIREDERKRIGREIHDDLGQQLTAVKMDVVWVDKNINDLVEGKKDPELVKQKIHNVIGLLDQSNQSIRRILSELRPSILDDYGLLDALQWHSSQFTRNTGIPVEISCNDNNVKLPESVATCIFRVFQESLTNISRYSKANKVNTNLTITRNSAEIKIVDNGIGFNIDEVNNRKSFGLLGIKERVSALNGKFDLKTSIGKGTRIKIKIPIID